MQFKHQDSLQNGTVVDFRPAYDRIADLEHTYLECDSLSAESR